MGTTSSGRCALLLAILLSSLPAVWTHAKDVVLTFSPSTDSAISATEVRFWLNALNPSNGHMVWVAPAELPCRLRSGHETVPIIAHLEDPSADSVRIPPHGFVRNAYSILPPKGWIGAVELECDTVPGTRLALDVSVPTPVTDAPPAEGSLAYLLKGRKHAASKHEPDTFFKQHIFGYEPFYFIGGSDSPNAKFQISFKYRLLNDRGWFAQLAPPLVGFHLAYSQTSLWDLNAPSAPFFDSSYRPELLYSWDNCIGDSEKWFRLDFQGGLQHESNGKSEPDSRSLNIAYVRPRFSFGRDTGLQLTLMPRAWVYVADVDDNPDIADYRGYADLRTILGWKRGLQISALGRIGQRLSQGNLTVDATYPLMQPPTGSFSIYLHAQYFTGYGESLLGYRERSDVFRAGISLYR
jgi:phospholipase A1